MTKYNHSIYKSLSKICYLLIALVCFTSCQNEHPEKPNILFIAVDDMRPELGCYGDDHVISPNIDRIANAGVTFENAFCQSAVCNPSRASLLTGLRPDAIKIWDLGTNFRKTVPDVITLPQYFIENGYNTTKVSDFISAYLSTI